MISMRMAPDLYQMNRIHYLLVITALLLPSCGGIKNEGRKFVAEGSQQVKDKSEDLANKVIPRFDAYEADTKFNRERFLEFLKVELTPDVKKIYCFNDNVGIDADYQFSFHCNAETAIRIIEKHKLTLDTTTTDYAFGLQDNFAWWDKEKIAKLRLYSRIGEHGYYQYFWYDETEQKAYYFDFDM
jgi:hypothetical protein